MVANVCSRSQGHPVRGVRSAAMISIRRAMSRDGFTRKLATADREEQGATKPEIRVIALDRQIA